MATPPGVVDEGESSHSSDEGTPPVRDSNNNVSNAGGKDANKKVSCQPCREAKVKCIPSSSAAPSEDAPAPCSRCVKLERECYYRTHKRGRKPGKIKLQQILRRLELLDRTLNEIRELNKEVRDADATSLIETLLWQLHRSKFFSKGNSAAMLGEAGGSGGSGGSGVGAKEKERGVKREESSPHPSFGSAGSSGGTPGPGQGMVGANAVMAKSRSDFNMLVDMEDHASVARVPDEFPTLSNPLKLLAQASSEESERRRRPRRSLQGVGGSGLRRQTSFDPQEHSSEDEREDEAGTRRATSQPRLLSHTDGSRKRPRSRSPSPATAAASRPNDDHPTEQSAAGSAVAKRNAGASTWASTYFSRGAFHPVYDNRQEFDPIDQGLLSVAQASRLIDSFYASFGTFMHIFDPTLSTITYIRKHSAFLLTVICALAAEFEPSTDADVQAESAGLALSLRRHYEGMITWITSGDYKNVEMAQAFFLLASYRPMSESATSDQTWLFLGTAIRIATELGCNLVCYSYGTTGVSEGKEHYQRQLRNTERLWINLWNLEKTLASQTGQRMHLADEGVIATCSRWHRMPVALRQDEALVAQVELRRIMIAQGDHFNTHVLRSLGARRRVAGSDEASSRGPHRAGETGGGREAENVDDEEDPLTLAERDQLSLQLSYFRNSVTMDLKRWEERWLSSASASNSDNTGPTPLQITGPLTLDYAALVTYALPLPITYTVDVTPELAQLHRHCYISCTNYMATFIDRSERGHMDHVTNSTIVSTVYAVVFALDLARKQQAQERRHNKAKASSGGETKGVDFGFVSRKRVLNLARLTAGALDKIGEARRGRVGRSIASKYSAFLSGVLARFEPHDASGEENELEVEHAAQRGFASRGEQEGSERSAALQVGQGGEGRAMEVVSSRHLRRDHNHPVTAEHYVAGKQGTRASHSYSSNIHFSPLAQHPVPAHLTSGWTAPAPSPSWPANAGRYVPPPHHHQQPFHHQQQQQQPQQQPQQQQQQQQQQAYPGALSPATWFGHLHNTAQGVAGNLDEDPSWEWMMKDLDFFNVDGGGGGGEPILDQMGRLFG